MIITKKKLDELRQKQVTVKLRRGYGIKIGTDGHGRDNVTQGPKEMTLDGATAINNIAKFDAPNDIRAQLGLPTQAPIVSLKERMRKMALEQAAKRRIEVNEIVDARMRDGHINSKAEDDKPEPKRKPPKRGRTVRRPANDRSVGNAQTR